MGDNNSSMEGEDDFFDEVPDIPPIPGSSWQVKLRELVLSPNGKRLALIVIVALIALVVIGVAALIVILVTVSSVGSDSSTAQNETTPIESSDPVSYITDNICEGSYAQGQADWNYGVMVDLGSSGSRLSIYQWKSDEPVQPAPTGGPYFYAELRPGVSYYAGDPDGAADSLVDLLNYAEDSLDCVGAIVEDTPIFLFATAGLRLLPEEESDAILDSIRSLIFDQYDFYFQYNWAKIISGSEESIYDWLTVQQLLLVNHDASDSTVGVVDMGGGSVEVTFDPISLGSPYDNDYIRDVDWNEEEYQVYGYSYLPYGHNSAREWVQAILAETQPGDVVENPCYLVGFNHTNPQPDGSSPLFVGTGNPDECVDVILQLFNDSVCDFVQCTFNGIYQPLIEGGQQFYGLDNLARVVNFLQLPSQTQLDTIDSNSRQFCEMTWEEAQDAYPDELDGITLFNGCFEGLYAYSLLTAGLKFSPESTQFTFVGELYGVDVSWTWGAMTDQVATLNL